MVHHALLLGSVLVASAVAGSLPTIELAPDSGPVVSLGARQCVARKRHAALVLTAVRRLIRPADAPSLPAVRSLAYFMLVISNTHGKNSRASSHPEDASIANAAATPSAWDDT